MTDPKALARELAAKMVLSDRPTPKQGTKPSAWSPDEDELMRRHYIANGAVGMVPMLPGRTRKAVSQRALKLGLSVPQDWTAEQDAILVAHYRSDGAAYVGERVGKSVFGVRHRAAVLGIKGDIGRHLRGRPVEHLMRRKRTPRQEKAAEKPVWRDTPQRVKTFAPKPVYEPIITSETRITQCPHGVDKRYTAEHAPRVVDSAECRSWAKALAA